MRIELKNGQWVEVREALTRADRRAVLGALNFTVEDGKTVVPGNLADLQMTAFLGQVITAWSFEGRPVPADNIGGTAVLDEVLADLDDSNALEEAVRPLFEKVVPPNRRASGKRPATSNGS